jgi:hypothetical protein
MKRLTTLLAVAAMLSSLTGCCLCPAYGNACNPCSPGYGPVFPGGVPAYTPQGAYQSYDAVTGLPLPTTTAYQPVAVAAPAVALGPLEALPTYR